MPLKTTSTTSTTSSTTTNTATAITNGSNSLQEKRRRLQESLKQKKLDKKRSMGLIPAVTNNDDNNKPHPSSMEFVRSLSTIPKKKKRSLSPVPPDNSRIPDPVPLEVIEKPLQIEAEDSHIMDENKVYVHVYMLYMFIDM